jgi:hypothetical protein
MYNVLPLAIGEDLDVGYDGGSSYPTKRDLKEQGAPGTFTYRRGLSSDGSESNPWGHIPDNYTDAFLPNRLLWTFEGYGTDGSTLPWDDGKMVLTGTWLIDRVQIDAKGNFSVECRDLAKLLIEQRLYPPIVPLDNYPVEFCSDREETTDKSTQTTTTTSTPEVIGTDVARHSTDVYDSSAAPWYGTNASVYGHQASHAFDGDPSTYWISMRNSVGGISTDWSFEWLDAMTDGQPINRIRFKPWVGNYVLYVGVMENGVWQGTQRVPYNPNAEPAYPNGADILYVQKLSLPVSENWFTIDLDRVYSADRVRLVFTNLQDFGRISGGDFRAGVYEFEVMGYTPAGTSTETVDVTEEVVTQIPGNIDDYTDMVKLFLAWAGFYWAEGEDDPLFLEEEWGSRGGRVWGDFFYSGAYPVEPACIPGSYWDNKSVMDAINQVKETLGFLGYVDATGGFIWRPPNIWANGNYITGDGWRGESSIPIVAENNLIMDYGVTVDDQALRSEIVVVADGDPAVYGSYSPGYAEGEEAPKSIEGSGETTTGEQVVTDLSLLAGQQRVMIVPDYPFGGVGENRTEEAARAEVEKFAYLVSLWIHWSYRKGKVRIPANPALDVDDQIRIYEAKTSETYIHYILGMNVTLDMQSGSYVADIETHWLGNGPESQWHMFINDLPPALLAYLCQQKILEGAPCGEPDEGDVGLPFDPELPEVPDTPLPTFRTPPHLRVPYPNLPDVDPAPPIDDGIGGGTYVPPDGSGGGDGGGSVSSCGNEFMWAYWPGTGPTRSGGKITGAPASRRKLRHSDSYGGWTILDNRVWNAFNLLADIFNDKGVFIETASGKYQKHVSGSSSWSNHSWGTACDLNGAILPVGRSIHSYSAALRNKYLAIASAASAIRGYDGNVFVGVFYWGENFSNNDPMHWQVCCKASDLSRGVWDVSNGYPTSFPQ